MSFFFDEPNEPPIKMTIYLWLALWAATLYHAGLTVWAMFSMTHLPSGYEIPPAWLDLIGPGPTAWSFWGYVAVLLTNVVWESKFKGQKTYVKPGFPFPDFLYSQVAISLWSVLWLFGHLGSHYEWFAYPAWLGDTFVMCLFIGFVQYRAMKAFRDPETFKKEFGDEAKKTSEAPQPKAQAGHPYPLSSEDEEITRKLLDYVHQNGQAKTGGLVGVLGSPRRTVIRNLNKLLADGRLVREGNGASAVYRLNTSTKADRFN